MHKLSQKISRRFCKFSEDFQDFQEFQTPCQQGCDVCAEAVSGVELASNPQSSVLHSRSRTNCDNVDDENRPTTSTTTSGDTASTLKQSMHGHGQTPHSTIDHRTIRCTSTNYRTRVSIMMFGSTHFLHVQLIFETVYPIILLTILHRHLNLDQDKVWLHHPITFDWKADLTGTSSGSQKCESMVD